MYDDMPTAVEATPHLNSKSNSNNWHMGTGTVTPGGFGAGTPAATTAAASTKERTKTKTRSHPKQNNTKEVQTQRQYLGTPYPQPTQLYPSTAVIPPVIPSPSIAPTTIPNLAPPSQIKSMHSPSPQFMYTDLSLPPPGMPQGFIRSPSMGHPPDLEHNPWLARAPSGGLGLVGLGADPYSIHTSAFDPPPLGGPSQPSPNAGAGPVIPPKPSSWYTPRTQAHDLEKGFMGRDDGDDDEGFGAGGWPVPGLGGNAFSGYTAPGPAVTMPKGYAFGPRAKYTRPDDWRKDYAPKQPGTLTKLLSLAKFSGSALHWTLDAKSPNCSWDIRRSPEDFLVLPDRRPLSYLELQESAISSSSFKRSQTQMQVQMQVVHTLLPWVITVTSSPSQVITVSHLLWTIYDELNNKCVNEGDFWNDAVDEEERKEIYSAWTVRCRGDRAEAAKGLKRVDFLKKRWVFEGLRKEGDSWVMRLKKGGSA